MNKLFFLVVLGLVVVVIRGRVFKQDFTLPALRRNKGWTFLDRMKLGQGVAEIRFSSKLATTEGQTTKPYTLQLSMIPDRLWNSQQLMKCSRDTNSLVPEGQDQQGLSQQTIFSNTINLQNNYDEGILQTVKIPKTQTYHFILKDCQKQLISNHFSRESRLVVELQIKNNGREFGEDEGGYYYWFPLLIIGTVLMLKLIDKSLVSKPFDSKDTDYVKFLVISSIWINLISLIFKYIGFLIYYYAGHQYSFFDFMHVFFHSVADSVIVSLFLFVSYGWTITSVSGLDFDLYVPLVCLMGLINVILNLLNKITDGSHDKYHMYDTIPAYLFVFFKLITIIIFLVGCVKTIYQTKKEPQVRRFMIQILVLGGLYISSVPLVMFTVQYIPASSRKEWVFISVQLGKTFICLLLTYMISFKKSGYRSVSLGEQSFMQSNGRVL